MSDNLFQDAKHKNFIDNVEMNRRKRASSQIDTGIKSTTIKISNFTGVNSTLRMITEKFKSDIKEFLDKQTGIDFNTILYSFKKISFLDEISMLFDKKLLQENNLLQAKLKQKQETINQLQNEINYKLQKTFDEDLRKSQLPQQFRKNFSASGKDVNFQISKVLYQKAKLINLQEFHELFNHYHITTNVKIINVKDPTKIQQNDNEQVKGIIKQSINEVKRTMSRSGSRNEYISNILKEAGKGRKQKIEILTKILSNENVLKSLQQILENNGVCSKPCCVQKIDQQQKNYPYSKSQNLRYQNPKKISQNYYKSDKIDKFLERFTSNMRQRNSKEADIRSLAKSNLQAAENYEKVYMKKLEKRRKYEYIQKRKFDQTLLQFNKQLHKTSHQKF